MKQRRDLMPHLRQQGAVSETQQLRKAVLDLRRAPVRLDVDKPETIPKPQRLTQEFMPTAASSIQPDPVMVSFDFAAGDLEELGPNIVFTTPVVTILTVTAIDHHFGDASESLADWDGTIAAGHIYFIALDSSGTIVPTGSVTTIYTNEVIESNNWLVAYGNGAVPTTDVHHVLDLTVLEDPALFSLIAEKTRNSTLAMTSDAGLSGDLPTDQMVIGLSTMGLIGAVTDENSPPITSANATNMTSVSFFWEWVFDDDLPGPVSNLFGWTDGGPLLSTHHAWFVRFAAVRGF